MSGWRRLLPGPRWFRWVLCAVLILVCLGLAVRLLAMSSLGRSLVESRIEALSISGQSIEIDDLEGDLLGRFSIGALRVSDVEGEWLAVDHVSVAWSPIGLLGRTLDVNALEMQELHAQRRPILIESSDSAAGDSDGFLRTYTVERFEVETLRLDDGVAGPSVLATLDGRVNTTVGTGFLDVSLTPRTPSGDVIDGTLNWGGDIPLDGRLIARGPENGLLANVISPTRPGEIALNVSGSGTPEDWSADAQLEIGAETVIALEATGLGSATQATARADLSAFNATLPAAIHTGSDITLRLDQSDHAQLEIESDGIDATFKAPWNKQRAGPDPTSIEVDAALKRPFSIETQRAQIGAGNLSGLVSVDGNTISFNGAATLDDISGPWATAQKIELPGQLRLDRKRNTLDVVADVETLGIVTDGDAVTTYLGQSPSLSIDAQIDLSTRRANIRDAVLSARAADVALSGLLGADRDSIDVRGRILGASEALLPQRIEIGSGRFTAQSRGEGRLDISVNLPLSFDAPPHPLLAGDYDATLDALLTPDNAIEIDALTLAGQQVSASARGRVSADTLDTVLSIQLDSFEQEGLTLEPVEVRLRAIGPLDNIALEGQAATAAAQYGEFTVAAPSVQFDGSYSDAGLEGTLLSSASLENRTFRGRATIGLDGSSWRVDDLDAALDAMSLRGSASGAGTEDIRADLTLNAPTGTLDGVGAISGNVQVAGATLDTRFVVDGVSREGFRIDTLALRAAGPMAAIDGALELNGVADLAETEQAIELSLPFELDAEARTAQFSPNAIFGDMPITTEDPIKVALTETGIVASGTVGLLGGRIDAEGTRGDGAIALTGRARSIDAGALARLVNRPALRGALGAEFSLQGEADQLSGDLQLDLINIAQARPNAPEIDGRLSLALANDTLQASLDLADTDGAVSLTGTAELTVLASAAPFSIAPRENARLQSRFDGQGAIEPIWSLLGSIDTALEGQFNLAATVTGPLDDLSPEGRLQIRQGRLEDALVGLHLIDIDMDADLSPEAVTVRTLTASGARGGSVTGSGRYGFGGTSSVELDLSRLNALQRSDLRAVVSGPLSLTDAATGARLTGALTFQSAEVNIDQLPTGGYTTLDVKFPDSNGEVDAPETPERVPIALDIDLRADRRIRVLGAGLETEWRMDANLGGTARAPFLTGTAELVRGDVDVLGRSFPLAGSAIRFNGAIPDAELALQAKRTDDGFTAGFEVTGTVRDPEFELTSTPQVPDDEVLSRALFGTSPSQLSTLQAAQLAAGLAQLAGGGGPDLLGGLEDALDVDRIDLGFAEDGTASLGAGKYIADDVYLEITTNTRGAPGLGVEWTPRDNVEVGAEFGTEVTPRFSIQWTRDYGGPDTPAEAEPSTDARRDAAPEP